MAEWSKILNDAEKEYVHFVMRQRQKAGKGNGSIQQIIEEATLVIIDDVESWESIRDRFIMTRGSTNRAEAERIFNWLKVYYRPPGDVKTQL